MPAFDQGQTQQPTLREQDAGSAGTPCQASYQLVLENHHLAVYEYPLRGMLSLAVVARHADLETLHDQLINGLLPSDAAQQTRLPMNAKSLIHARSTEACRHSFTHPRR